jgi:hypothetical protein
LLPFGFLIKATFTSQVIPHEGVFGILALEEATVLTDVVNAVDKSHLVRWLVLLVPLIPAVFDRNRVSLPLRPNFER